MRRHARARARAPVFALSAGHRQMLAYTRRALEARSVGPLPRAHGSSRSLSLWRCARIAHTRGKAKSRAAADAAPPRRDGPRTAGMEGGGEARKRRRDRRGGAGSSASKEQNRSAGASETMEEAASTERRRKQRGGKRMAPRLAPRKNKGKRGPVRGTDRQVIGELHALAHQSISADLCRRKKFVRGRRARFG